MTRDEWRKYFTRLPEAASDYLLSSASGENEDDARENLGYDYDAWDRVADIVWDLLFLKDSQAVFQQKIRAVAGDRRPDEVESELLLHMVYPLADLVPWDVETRLQELGITPAAIQEIPRISVMPVTYTAAARRIATNAKVSMFQEALVRRLRDLVVSVITGVRNDDQAREFLMRKQADGGLGMTSDQANSYLKEMNSFIDRSVIMSEQEYSEWYRTARLKEQAMWKQEDSSEEDEEGGNEEAPRVQKGGINLSKRYEPVLQEAIKDCLQQIGDLSLSEYLQKRLENVISTRLRNVRNSLQVSNILTRDEKIGGLGLDSDTAERVGKIIEASYELHHTAIEQDQKRKIEDAQATQKQKIAERKIKESEDHADWYQSKVAAPSFQNVMQSQAPGTTMSSAPSGAIRTNVAGVTAPPRQLSDLIGEFQTFDIQEFRRLSKDPDQAGEKLFQKFETLRSESFDRYTAGIAAWRSSPLQERYLQLVSESFSAGKTVAEVAEAHLVNDPNTPTAAELGAIITLNAKIQY